MYIWESHIQERFRDRKGKCTKNEVRHMRASEGRKVIYKMTKKADVQ